MIMMQMCGDGNSDHVHVFRPILLQVVPVYCFDPRHYGTTPWGVKKTGDYRAKFLLESINDLKQNLQQVYIFAHIFPFRAYMRNLSF